MVCNKNIKRDKEQHENGLREEEEEEEETKYYFRIVEESTKHTYKLNLPNAYIKKNKKRRKILLLVHFYILRELSSTQASNYFVGCRFFISVLIAVRHIL